MKRADGTDAVATSCLVTVLKEDDGAANGLSASGVE